MYSMENQSLQDSPRSKIYKLGSFGQVNPESEQDAYFYITSRKEFSTQMNLTKSLRADIRRDITQEYHKGAYKDPYYLEQIKKYIRVDTIDKPIQQKEQGGLQRPVNNHQNDKKQEPGNVSKGISRLKQKMNSGNEIVASQEGKFLTLETLFKWCMLDSGREKAWENVKEMKRYIDQNKGVVSEKDDANIMGFVQAYDQWNINVEHKCLERIENEKWPLTEFNPEIWKVEMSVPMEFNGEIYSPSLVKQSYKMIIYAYHSKLDGYRKSMKQEALANLEKNFLDGVDYIISNVYFSKNFPETYEFALKSQRVVVQMKKASMIKSEKKEKKIIGKSSDREKRLKQAETEVGNSLIRLGGSRDELGVKIRQGLYAFNTMWLEENNNWLKGGKKQQVSAVLKDKDRQEAGSIGVQLKAMYQDLSDKATTIDQVAFQPAQKTATAVKTVNAFDDGFYDGLIYNANATTGDEKSKFHTLDKTIPKKVIAKGVEKVSNVGGIKKDFFKAIKDSASVFHPIDSLISWAGNLIPGFNVAMAVKKMFSAISDYKTRVKQIDYLGGMYAATLDDNGASAQDRHDELSWFMKKTGRSLWSAILKVVLSVKKVVLDVVGLFGLHAISEGLDGLIDLTVYLSRLIKKSTKAAYKKIKGTKGEHRRLASRKIMARLEALPDDKLTQTMNELIGVGLVSEKVLDKEGGLEFSARKQKIESNLFDAFRSY